MIALTPVDRCFFCDRREAEMNVDLEGRVVGCCETCWMRAEDERPREGDDDDA